MSSFISSLLTELGIRTRLSRHPPQADEAETLRSGQTKSTSTSDCQDPTVVDSGQDVATGGNAGSLHGPPFFTTLPKDMDGRISEPEGTRPSPQNGPLNSQPTASNGSPDDPARAADVVVDPTSHGSIQPHHGESTVPSVTGSLLRREGNGQPLNHVFTIDEASQSLLPADDGMSLLRNKIHGIQGLDLSNNEKARMIHDLMTESYNSSRTISPSLFAAMSPTLSPSSLAQPASLPVFGTKQSPEPKTSSSTPAASIPQYENQFSLTSEDLQPTYAPRTEPESPVVDTGDEDPDTEDLEETFLGCQHYQRNVKLQCYTCKKWYTCRFCHDDVEDHHLIRRDTENMLCMLCGHAQPAAQTCRHCDEQTAQHYCDICKLWDNDGKKSIYHCNDCGICRIGQGLGKDFFHCKVGFQMNSTKGLSPVMLTWPRHAPFVCLSRLRTRIGVSRDPPSATVRFVAITCSPPRKLWL